MLMEKITELIGAAPASVQDLLYVFAFIFMIYLVDRLVVLITALFSKR